jgi:hypothetical protein
MVERRPDTVSDALDADLDAFAAEVRALLATI